ncbi:MAG: hypothetical protein LBD48_07150 [Treponema sp.]|jgi:hypothetical protein|nr:hypothetical protein [Treponema sp.]
MADIAAVPVKKPHFLWIEMVRLLGIWLVIIAHIGTTDFLQRLFDVLILQVLIFVSGYLERNDRPFRETLTKGVKGLFVPYLLLSVLLYVYWLIMDIVFHRDIYTLLSTERNLPAALLKPVIGIFLSNGQYETPYSMMLAFAMWYLPVVFILKMAHRAVMVISRGNRRHYFVCLAVSLLLIMAFRNYIQPLGLVPPFCLDRALLLFPFFEFGNILKEMNVIRPLEKLTFRFASLCIVTGTIGFITLGMILPLWNGNSTFLYLLLGMTAIVSVISFSMLYTRPNALISLMSNGTLLILAFHAVFIPFARRLFAMLKIDGYLYSVILQSLLILCIFIIPINIAQKYFPVLIGSRKSG